MIVRLGQLSNIFLNWRGYIYKNSVSMKVLQFTTAVNLFLDFCESELLANLGVYELASYISVTIKIVFV